MGAGAAMHKKSATARRRCNDLQSSLYAFLILHFFTDIANSSIKKMTSDMGLLY
jgi:hypothetical protein